MCTIGYDRMENSIYKLKEPGRKNYESLVIGYEGDQFLEVLAGAELDESVDLVEEVKRNPLKRIEMRSYEEKIPESETNVSPDMPVKQLVLTPTGRMPYIASVSHDDYDSGWGGCNPELSVFTAAVRHHSKDRYRPYSKMVTHMLENHTEAEECLNYLEDVTDKEAVRGFNMVIKDNQKQFLIESVPEDFVDGGSFCVKELSGDEAETNFSRLNGFFWDGDWKPYEGDPTTTHHFIRSLNRYLAHDIDMDLDKKLECHLRYEDLFDVRTLNKAYEMFLEKNLDDVVEELGLDDPVVKPSFYTNCTHDKLENITEGESPVSFKKTAWTSHTDQNFFNITYGQPCESKLNFFASLEDIESLSQDLGEKYQFLNPRKKDI